MAENPLLSLETISFWRNIQSSFPFSFDISFIKDETKNLSRNVEHQALSDAVLHPRRTGKLTAPLRKPNSRFTHSMPFPCQAHAVPLPCRAAKGLECVFLIWFKQCGRFWFTLAMTCHAHATLRPCCVVALRRTAWSEHCMASMNQTRPHCVNQMGKTHSKPLAARHGRGKAWARHGKSMPCVNRP